MAVGWRSGPSVGRRPRGKVAGRSMAEASHIGKQGRLAPKETEMESSAVPLELLHAHYAGAGPEDRRTTKVGAVT